MECKNRLYLLFEFYVCAESIDHHTWGYRSILAVRLPKYAFIKENLAIPWPPVPVMDILCTKSSYSLCTTRTLPVPLSFFYNVAVKKRSSNTYVKSVTDEDAVLIEPIHIILPKITKYTIILITID